MFCFRINRKIKISFYALSAEHELIVRPFEADTAQRLEECLRDLVVKYGVRDLVKVVVKPHPVVAVSCPRL